MFEATEGVGAAVNSPGHFAKCNGFDFATCARILVLAACLIVPSCSYGISWGKKIGTALDFNVPLSVLLSKYLSDPFYKIYISIHTRRLPP